MSYAVKGLICAGTARSYAGVDAVTLPYVATSGPHGLPTYVIHCACNPLPTARLMTLQWLRQQTLSHTSVGLYDCAQERCARREQGPLRGGAA
jgi:hypothetical protein